MLKEAAAEASRAIARNMNLEQDILRNRTFQKHNSMEAAHQAFVTVKSVVSLL